MKCESEQSKESVDKRDFNDISKMSVTDKSELIKKSLLSEASSLYVDMKGAALGTDMEIKDIAALDMERGNLYL